MSMTRLEKIEAERLDHVASKMAAALPSGLPADAVLAAARAAIEAVDRFPEDPQTFPFDFDLNRPPARLPVHARRSIEEIDATVFNGDTFDETEHHLYLAAHLQRWSKVLRLRREDDWRNRPEEDPEP